MSSLYNVTTGTKKLIKFTAIGIGAIVGIMIFINIAKAIIGAFTPPPPPTVSFGKLTPLQFPQNTTSPVTTYVVDTETGTLPNLPDRAAVYKIIQPEPQLTAAKQAAQTASGLGFDSDPIPLSQEWYRWIDTTSVPQRNLTYNIYTNNFTIDSNYKNDTGIQNPLQTLDKDEVLKEVTQEISGLPVPITDIDIAKTIPNLLSIQNGELIPSSGLGAAQIVKIDLFQKDVNNIPITYAHPPSSNMDFLVGSPQVGKRYLVVSANYIHQVVDADYSWVKSKDALTGKTLTYPATYPIITATQAFGLLQKGQAYIAAYYGTSNSVNIKNVSIKYYIGEQQQDYLEPVIVFEGDNGFVAYVPAIVGTWIGQ